MKPSPAPWHRKWVQVFDRNHNPIAVCGPRAESEADAEFMALAPAMLWLLRHKANSCTAHALPAIDCWDCEVAGLVERYWTEAREAEYQRWLLDKHGRG